jgi:hypothetical protein
MRSLAEADEAVLAAEQRLANRAAHVRESWRMMNIASRNMLTGPWMVGGVAIAGAWAGRRSKKKPVPVECKCVPASRSFLGVAFMAMAGPLLQELVAQGSRRLGEADWGRATTAAPSPASSGPVDPTSA